MNLIDRIDAYLLKKEERERTSYYPSEVSKCTRQLYYKWTKTTISNPIEAGGYWKMKMGDKIHDLIHEFLEETGLEIIPEISFEKDIGLKYPLSGRIDNIFIDEDDEISGIEVKSSYGAGIKNIQKNGYPKEYDLEQILVYMGCTEIQRFYLIYIGRDNGYRTQFIIDYRGTGKMLCCDGNRVHTNYDKILNKFRNLEDFMSRMEVPNREYKVAIKQGQIKDKFQKNKIEYKTDWQCSYCQYLNLCWQEEIEKYKDSDNSKTFKEKSP